METIHLIGAEDVAQAGRNFAGAAQEMTRAANTISEALRQCIQEASATFAEKWAQVEATNPGRIQAVPPGESEGIMAQLTAPGGDTSGAVGDSWAPPPENQPGAPLTFQESQAAPETAPTRAAWTRAIMNTPIPNWDAKTENQPGCWPYLVDSLETQLEAAKKDAKLWAQEAGLLKGEKAKIAAQLEDATKHIVALEDACDQGSALVGALQTEVTTLTGKLEAWESAFRDSVGGSPDDLARRLESSLRDEAATRKAYGAIWADRLHLQAVANRQSIQIRHLVMAKEGYEAQSREFKRVKAIDQQWEANLRTILGIPDKVVSITNTVEKLVQSVQGVNHG